MIALVTGASGFLGSHLVDTLLARGDTVLALQRKRSVGTVHARLKVLEGDILDAAFLPLIIKEHSPQEIYHLAAQSFPNISWENPWQTHHINVLGTLNMLEAARQAKQPLTVVAASSSAVYAQKPDSSAIHEDDATQPASPYGVSKLAADHYTRLYARHHGVRAIVARPFFFIGPRKTGDVISDWVQGVVSVENGKGKELAVGNVEAIRDFLHIQDGIDALTTLAAKGAAGEAYNICSGRGSKLSDLLQTLVGLSRSSITVRTDAAKLRPLDERVKIGDSRKLQSLGWRERHNVEHALRETLDYWRKK